METIKDYLEDAIAAEKSFETQLTGFAKEATYEPAKSAFALHADETREQYERLTARLKALGGSPSLLKSTLAHLFNMAPKTAQLGHQDAERTTQDLIMAYSVENAEMAMYESLILAAETANDNQTATLAREIQAQEKETAEKVWKMIGPCASQAFLQVRVSGRENEREVIVRYLQDAEAAERNFEDALAGFSKSGDQADVQSLMAMMSNKARMQHQRLEYRLKELGGDRSVGKSILAHMLAFTPISAQAGHTASEKSTQHLMITYAAAAAERGMYESLMAAADTAGDSETARLARELQREESEDFALAWEHLGKSARNALTTVK
jgi:ferritin-like metal-binding protein YciE